MFGVSYAQVIICAECPIQANYAVCRYTECHYAENLYS